MLPCLASACLHRPESNQKARFAIAPQAAEKKRLAREKKEQQAKESELEARKRRDALYAEARSSNRNEVKVKKVGAG